MRQEKNTSRRDTAIVSTEYASEEEYWLNQLSGELTRGYFPYDYPQPGSGEPHTQAPPLLPIELSIPGDSFNRLLKLSKGIDYTLHMIFTTVVIVMLDKYTYGKKNGIIVGVPIYKQDSTEDFVNTVLAIRSQPRDNMTFKELLIDVRQTIIEAEENQNYPLEILLSKLDLPPGGDDFPLFDTAVLMESIHDKKYLDRVHVNIIFSFSRTGESGQVILEYNPTRYDKTTVKGIINHFLQLQHNCLLNMDARLDDIDMLTRQEKEKILIDFNHTGEEYPREKTIVELFAEQVSRFPDRTAVVCKDETVTYRQLNQRAIGLAGYLKSKGVKPDTIVAIMEERSPDTIVGILGILTAGGAYLPLAPEIPKRRMVSILNDAGVPMVLLKNRNIEQYWFTALQGLRTYQLEPTRTAPRPPIRELDRLIPDRTLVDYRKYNQYIGQCMARNAIVIQASRGCPYRCAYCHKIWPKKHISRSAESIFQEVKTNYELGMRKFAFVDDIFNLDRENSTRFFQLIIANGLKVQFFFPNGLRGDLLTPDYIDLMVEAGTVSCALALESASPRLQKQINKNLNLKKFRENIDYFCRMHPQLILELFTMHGFPGETEEEAYMTLEFVKGRHWIHFPYMNVLKIYPNTDMERIALENGISRESIMRSEDYAHYELSDICPFEKTFSFKYRSEFLNDYFLSKERLLHVLPFQVKVLSESELLQKYNSYLPTDNEITSFENLLAYLKITREELGIEAEGNGCAPEDSPLVYSTNLKNLSRGKRTRQRETQPGADALRILLLDLSQLFSTETEFLYDVPGVAPLGLMYLLTYLNQYLGSRVNGKIAKSRVDFDSYHRLKSLIKDYRPQVIGVRSLNIYKDFFHKVISLIRQWGFQGPIIAGGPYATSDLTTVVQDRNIDLVVLSEGEVTFYEVTRAILENNGKLPAVDVLETIKGIAYIPPEKRSTGPRHRDVVMTDELEKQFSVAPAENIKPINRPRDLAYVIYTSGSTGTPKGVMIRHHNVNNLVLGLNRCIYQHHDPGKALNVAQVAPYVFDASIKQIFGALLQGHSLHIVPEEARLDSDLLWDFYARHQIDISDSTPVHIKLMLETSKEYEGDTGSQPIPVKRFIIGGETLTAEVVKDFLNVYPGTVPRITNIYGLTECTVDSTSYEVNPGSFDAYRNIPIGKPMPNTVIYIVSIQDQPQPIGVPGELCIGGEGIGRGYLNNPELTAQKFYLRRPGGTLFEKTAPPGPPSKNFLLEGTRGLAPLLYHTGDLARWLPDGNIEFSGRIDQQVKIRGYRIELGEIENHLQKNKKISHAVVVAGEDIQKEQYLCAYIVPNFPGATPSGSSLPVLQPGEIREYLLEYLPDYMVPTHYIQLREIPLNQNGKVDRRALPEPRLMDAQQGVYAAPRDDVEEALAQLWARLFGIEKQAIGVNTDFFELGGHSLRATMLIVRIHKEMDVKIPLVEMFKTPTIRGLAKFIRKSRRKKHISIPRVEKKEYYPMSPAMKRLYFEQQLNPTSTHYNVTMAARLEGQLRMKQLQSIFNQTIRRHETLRTSFVTVNDEPVQKVRDSVGIVVDYFDLPPSPGEIIENFAKPFNMTQAPLFRVCLVRTAPDQYILGLEVHHMVADGTSVGLLMKEFMTIYSGETLPSLPIQYKDYSEWKTNREHQDLMSQQETYWLEQFQGDLPAMNLPCDYPRPPVKSFEGKFIHSFLGDKETEQLNKMAQVEDVTLYMVLAAIFNLFVSKITGLEDIVIGTPSAGRDHADLEPLIGMFVNTLMLRSYPSGNKTFKDFLMEVKQRTLQMFTHQEYNFEDLVRRVVPVKDVSRSPITDVFFALQNMEIPEVQIPGLRLRPYQYERKAARFDLSWILMEEDHQLRIYTEYSSKLFKSQTIERFIKFFKKIAVLVVKDPMQKISAIEIISGEEKHRILYKFNNTRNEFPRGKSITQLFEHQVETVPHHMALVGNEEGVKDIREEGWEEVPPGQSSNTFGEIWFSYGELNSKSNQLAYLLKEKGIEPDTIVGLMIARSTAMIIGILGILKAGGAYLPIDPDYPEERIDYMLKDSNVEVLLTTPGLSEKLLIVNCQLLIVNEVLTDRRSLYNPPQEPSSHLHLSPWINAPATSLAYIIYTSGSTGTPKGVAIEHRNVLNLISGLNYRIYSNFSSSLNIALIAPFIFDASVKQIFVSLLLGHCLFIVPHEISGDGISLIDYYRSRGVEISDGTPAHLLLLLEGKKESRLKGNIGVKYFLIGGEALHRQLVERFFLHFGTGAEKIINVYGPTECCVDSTLHEITGENINSPGVNITIGFPMPNQKVYILTETGLTQPVGIPGEICISGANVSRGYLNNPTLTSERFISAVIRHSSFVLRSSKRLSTNDRFSKDSKKKVPGNNHMQSCNHASMHPCNHETMQSSPHHSPHCPIYRTGDLARWLEDGSIEFLGRIDAQVKVRGYRIELGEIENQIMKHENVKETVVLVKDPGSGNDTDRFLCAYIVPVNSPDPNRESRGQSPEWQELREYLSTQLPDYMIPCFFVTLEKIPLTPNGKIDKKSLPDPQPQAGDTYTPPNSVPEEKLAEIWSDLLNISPIGIDDNFFQLGGYSLKVTLMISRIHRIFHVKVPLVEFFQAPSIRRLAQYIETIGPAKYTAIQPTEKRDFYPSSSAQKRLYFLQWTDPQSTLYNVPTILRLGGKIHRQAMEKTLENLIQRHESLRTSFQEINGEPVQRVHARLNFEVEYIRWENNKPTGEPDIQEIIRQLVRPFDLSRAPLLRIGLAIISPDEQVLVADKHHIVSDGVSSQILANQCLTLYRSGATAALQEMPVQYKDYCVWQDSPVQQKIIKKQEFYWLNRFKENRDEIPVLEIPLDYPRPREKTGKGAYIDFEIEPTAAEKLRVIALSQNATLFMIVLTLFNILLHKLSRQEDIILGTVNAGRRHQELENIVGMFVNTLVLRNHPQEEKSFSQFLKEVRQTTLEAFDNQDYQFEDLVEKLVVKRTPGRNPLFDVMFMFGSLDIQNTSSPTSAAPTLTSAPTPAPSLKPLEISGDQAKFDILFTGADHGDKFVFSFGYSTELFTEQTIKEFIKYFKQIIDAIVENKSILIKQISISYDLEAAKTSVSQLDRESFEF